jgi:hypothetical protein
MVLSELRVDCDLLDAGEWAIAVDGTVIRTRHHSAGARHRAPKDIPAAVLAPTELEVDIKPVKSTGDLSNDTNSGQPPIPVLDREGLGRFRGGVTTKIHLVADSRRRPIARVTTAVQWHDSVAFTAVMTDISITRSCRGPPRTRPDRVQADKTYSSKEDPEYVAVQRYQGDDRGAVRVATARYPRSTTNGSSSTRAPSMSRASESGYANPPTKILGTRLRTLKTAEPS